MTNTPSIDDLALAACPFCGGTPIMRGAFVECSECSAQGPTDREYKTGWNTRTSPHESATPPVGGPVAWRHKKRGSTYSVIGIASLQAEPSADLCEGDEITVYRGDDGKLWCRRREEFEDGRFELLATPQPQEPACREADEKLGDLLAKVLSHSSVDEAMQDAWNDICSDTGCHPLDIEHGKGKVLTFSPRHWANQVAKQLFLRALRLSSPAKRTASAVGDGDTLTTPLPKVTAP